MGLLVKTTAAKSHQIALVAGQTSVASKAAAAGVVKYNKWIGLCGTSRTQVQLYTGSRLARVW